MGIFKRGCDKNGPNKTCSKCGTKKVCGVYWYKFQWDGVPVVQSTRQRNDKVARQMESAHRTSLAKGEVGIREKKAAPILRDFLKNDFTPYVKTKHAAKPLTVRYYVQGGDMLLKSEMAGLRLDEITDQQAREFACKHVALSASGINRGLRTLRRALNLAYEWNKIERPVKIKLATGERQRDRVLDEKEIENYLAACPQPWKDCATLILDEGFRPSEVFCLRWNAVLLKDDGTGLIRIIDGKSRAARRTLPMTPRVHALLSARYAVAESVDGWVFPSGGKSGHLNGDVTKDQHTKALVASGVQAFVPYTLRHTALTMLGAAAGDDPFVLARIAGHSSISTTQRYIHPQQEAVQRVFTASQLPVGTKMGTKQKRLEGATVKKTSIIANVYAGAGRGSRTPKTRRSADFESAASASSAIPAGWQLLDFRV
jgi:integrase